MSEPSELESRLANLEAAGGRGRGGWFFVAILAVLTLGFALLLFEFSLLQRQQASLTENTQSELFWRLCQPSSSVVERTMAFTRLVEMGHTEWRSAATQELQLKGVSLDGARLRGADLLACDLREASLIEADLTGCRLRMADLSGADLTRSTLDGADCLKATLDGADFNRAQMRSISLEQVRAQNARLVLADLSEALLLMADVSGADFTGANLTAASLESARLRGATLALTNLAEADLTNADLADSNWWRARGLTQAQLVQFAADFPPSEAADPSRRQDYLLWAEGFSPKRAEPSEARNRRPTDAGTE